MWRACCQLQLWGRDPNIVSIVSHFVKQHDHLCNNYTHEQRERERKAPRWSDGNKLTNSNCTCWKVICRNYNIRSDGWKSCTGPMSVGCGPPVAWIPVSCAWPLRPGRSGPGQSWSRLSWEKNQEYWLVTRRHQYDTSAVCGGSKPGLVFGSKDGRVAVSAMLAVGRSTVFAMLHDFLLLASLK